MRILLGAMAMLAATPAMATDYVIAGRAGGTALIVTDRDSVARQADGHVIAHMIYIMGEDRDGMSALDMTNEYDCDGRRYRRLRIGGLDLQGKVVRDEAPSGEWREAVDGETSGGILDFVCGHDGEMAGAVSLGRSLPAMIAEGRRRLSED